ncbi:MAG TPA: nitroreductase family deazaflavin-dependent oxidoreductase [Solirubrobacteraceae bacterium]|nr:nitroreductase family deazaflavin-dependent oxidoreductase [Solirubrobacteraceae bacterium]
MTETTTTAAARQDEERALHDAHVCDAATKHASKHTRLLRSATDGRVLSALMLPFFAVRPPSGYGVITTTGRKTGKTRRKCIRVIRAGDKAYIVQLRPPELAIAHPSATAGWLWNIRANPNVRLRIRGGTFAGVARELTESAELEQARTALCQTVNLFDYGECDFHLRGLPTRAKIKELHRYWFDTGIPLVVELGE